MNWLHTYFYTIAWIRDRLIADTNYSCCWAGGQGGMAKGRLALLELGVKRPDLVDIGLRHLSSTDRDKAT